MGGLGKNVHHVHPEIDTAASKRAYKETVNDEEARSTMHAELVRWRAGKERKRTRAEQLACGPLPASEDGQTAKRRKIETNNEEGMLVRRCVSVFWRKDAYEAPQPEGFGVKLTRTSSENLDGMVGGHPLKKKVCIEKTDCARINLSMWQRETHGE